MPDDAREGMMNHMAQQALTKSVPGPEVIAQVYRECSLLRYQWKWKLHC